VNRALAFWQGLALVLLGVLIGITLTRLVQPPFPPLRHGREWSAPWRRPFMSVMEARLGLTPGQRDSLAAILERHRRVFEAERREAERRMGPQRDSLREEVRAILTPEQQARFDRIARRWERWSRGRGDPD